ncbi:unnamed protein product, partial [Brenthis ino]
MLRFYEAKSNSEIDILISQFSQLMKSKWENIHSQANIFRYKIDFIRERLLDEKYLLQLNPSRSTNRRTPEHISEISQPFDENKFNFKKVSKDEIMFIFKESANEDSHVVLVNVSPITRYHSLLCPSIEKCLPQVITEDSLKLVIDLMLLAKDGNLRIGFNSLCALASVNHLHFHLFLEKNNLPIENLKCKHIKGPLYSFVDYPVPGFCFEITSSYKIDEIFKLIKFLLKKSIAHNVFITRGSSMEDGKGAIRLLVWPRKSSAGAKQLAAFNVAVCELSGWFPVYNCEDFENLKKEDIEKELRKWRIDDFDQLCEEVKLIY